MRVSSRKLITLRLKYTDSQYYQANTKYAVWVKFCNVSSGNDGSTIILHIAIGTLSKPYTVDRIQYEKNMPKRFDKKYNEQKRK